LNSVLGLQTSSVPGWRAPEIITTVVTHLLAAYFFLVAVSVAEFGGQFGWRRYFVAAAAATTAAVALEMTLIALLPSPAGWNYVPDNLAWVSKATWSAANWSLTGGLAVAVYARFQTARRARRALNAAEFERATAGREVLATRLAAMQAQVEPQFLQSTLAQIEALYDRDAQSGGRMLDSLIVYLRAALPQLRGEGSTLEREARFVESYLRIVQLRMGSRLEFAIEIPGALSDSAFPPMLLLPLIDDALRTGLEPLALGGRIDIRARAEGDRLRVVVVHNGLRPPECPTESPLLATLRERLEGLYGPNTQLRLITDVQHDVSVVVEVPNETARDYR
jgi:LytS/YehU family sensor histidine kinase